MEWCILFFFQAEGGIRDIGVTGVQTCALPISVLQGEWEPLAGHLNASPFLWPGWRRGDTPSGRANFKSSPFRSEERRVGQECRSRWSPYHLKKTPFAPEFSPSCHRLCS